MKIICKKFDKLSVYELYDLLQLRAEVFVVEQDCVYLDLDNKDKDAYHLLIYNDDILAVTTRILAPGISYPNCSSIGRVCSNKNLRHLSYGKKAMELSIEYCYKFYSGSDIKISAQSYLIKFYSEFGFEAIGKEYIEDNIPHIGMIKKLAKK